MNMQSRIWTEQDFNELYEESPKIMTVPTYITVYLSIDSQTIPVKVPSTVTEETLKFLLYKAIYFYYLDQKHTNPLFKTAQISCFQSTMSYTYWYKLWSQGVGIPKNSNLHCITYSKQESIFKYIPLALIQQSELCTKILARSRKQGKYYKICIYQHSTVNDDYLNFLYQNYKLFQHPFHSRLCQTYKTTKFTYFIFQHNPYKFQNLLQSDCKLIKQQINTYFVQLLMALIYLEQQQFNIWQIQLDTIDINIDGHLIVNQNILNTCQNKNQQRNKNNVQFLYQFFNILLAKSNITKQHERNDYQNYVNFGQYLCELLEKKRVTMKQVLNHSFIQQINLQNILIKNGKVCEIKDFINNKMQYEQLDSLKIEEFYKNYQEGYQKNGYKFYESYQIIQQTRQQIILNKYSPFVTQRNTSSTHRNILLKRNNSNSKLSQRNTNPKSYASSNSTLTYKRIQQQSQNMAMNSPYYTVLKKQSILKRKKPAKAS